VTLIRDLAGVWHGAAVAIAGTLAAAAVHLGRLIIRRLERRAQSCIVKAISADETTQEEIHMASGSWANRFIFGPIAALLSGSTSSADPQVKAAGMSLQTAIATDLSTVNPLFDLAASEVEAIADKLLQSMGPLGYVADGAIAHPVMVMGATMLKQMIDHKLGIAPLPAGA
jgi:hypothetical protein